MDRSHNSNSSYYHSTSSLLASSNTQENQLTRRLYKNFSQSRIDKKQLDSQSHNTTRLLADSASYRSPLQQLQGASFLRKHSAGESVLVPRIAARFKGFENSTEHKMQIEKGKFMLLSDTPHQSMEVSISRRHLFSKLDSLDLRPVGF
jgi:hypothetical protein